MSGRVVSNNIRRVWFSDSGTYPVLASCAVAVAWCGYMSSRHLFTSPDVTWDKSERAKPMRDHHDIGERWAAPKRNYIAKDKSKIAVLSSNPLRYSGRQ